MLVGTFFAVLAGTSFGLLGILARLAYAQGLDVGQALLCRFIFGSLLLFVPMLLLRPQLLRLDTRGLAWAAFLGMGCYCGQSTFYFLAIKHIPVATASLLIYSALAGVALLEWARAGPDPLPPCGLPWA